MPVQLTETPAEPWEPEAWHEQEMEIQRRLISSAKIVPREIADLEIQQMVHWWRPVPEGRRPITKGKALPSRVSHHLLQHEHLRSNHCPRSPSRRSWATRFSELQSARKPAGMRRCIWSTRTSSPATGRMTTFSPKCWDHQRHGQLPPARGGRR